MATRFKSVIALLALVMGCVAPAPLPTATPVPADTPVPFVARQLDVKIDPKDAATYLLNPSPLGKGGYSKGMVVTIDILPKQGWQVEEWVGPVKTPFAGEIVAANDDVESDATILNRSPYKQGWIVRIKPSNFDEDGVDLVSGNDAISGFETYMAEKEISECIHCEGFEG